jgi:hypothetical protein
MPVCFCLGPLCHTERNTNRKYSTFVSPNIWHLAIYISSYGKRNSAMKWKVNPISCAGRETGIVIINISTLKL